MSITAVVTNCALIAMSPQIQQYVPLYGGVTVVVVVVIAEVGIDKLVSDYSECVNSMIYIIF